MAMASWQGVTLRPATTMVAKVVLVLLSALKSAVIVPSGGRTAADKSAARLAARVRSRGRAAIGKLDARLAARVLFRGQAAVDKSAVRLAA